MRTIRSIADSNADTSSSRDADPSADTDSEIDASATSTDAESSSADTESYATASSADTGAHSRADTDSNMCVRCSGITPELHLSGWQRGILGKRELPNLRVDCGQ
jgi:hypothetical protein